MVQNTEGRCKRVLVGQGAGVGEQVRGVLVAMWAGCGRETPIGRGQGGAGGEQQRQAGVAKKPKRDATDMQPAFR
jgi:hypothetical protein